MIYFIDPDVVSNDALSDLTKKEILDGWHDLLTHETALEHFMNQKFGAADSYLIGQFYSSGWVSHNNVLTISKFQKIASEAMNSNVSIFKYRNGMVCFDLHPNELLKLFKQIKQDLNNKCINELLSNAAPTL